jgi:uncharacterized protein (DUF2236 family)
MDQEALKQTEGYFGPDSATWEVYRESVFLLGGVRALLLQVAHPAIADGVARFSNFQTDAFGRAFRTFLAMGTLYYGNRAQAESVCQRLERIHTSITGSYLTRVKTIPLLSDIILAMILISCFGYMPR